MNADQAVVTQTFSLINITIKRYLGRTGRCGNRVMIAEVDSVSTWMRVGSLIFILTELLG